MAPKKADKKGTKELPYAIVSESDLAAAKAALADEAELKRQRSSMTYFLKSQGLDQAYSVKGNTAKKQFLANWMAKRMADHRVKTSHSSSQEFRSTTSSGSVWGWMGKEQMIKVLGEHKATAKIDSGLLKHRPDRDTTLDGEWDREYMLVSDQGEDKDENIRGEKLKADTADLDAEGAKLVNDFINDATSRIAGDGEGQAMQQRVLPTHHFRTSRRWTRSRQIPRRRCAFGATRSPP
jgi:hypothetical protein